MFFKDYSSFWKGLHDLMFSEGYKIGKKFAKEEYKTNIKHCDSLNKFKDNYLDSKEFDYDSHDSPIKFFFSIFYELENNEEFEYGGEFSKNMNRDFENIMLNGAWAGYCNFWDKYSSKIKTITENIIEDD